MAITLVLLKFFIINSQKYHLQWEFFSSDKITNSYKQETKLIKHVL